MLSHTVCPFHFITPSHRLFSAVVSHRGWSSPPSWRGAGRPAGSWRTGARMGWAGWEHRTGFSFLALPQTSHLGTALHSSHRKPHYDLRGPLKRQGNKKMRHNILLFCSRTWLMQLIKCFVFCAVTGEAWEKMWRRSGIYQKYGWI